MWQRKHDWKHSAYTKPGKSLAIKYESVHLSKVFIIVFRPDDRQIIHISMKGLGTEIII